MQVSLTPRLYARKPTFISGCADDAKKLFKDYDITASNLVELSTFAIAADASYAALKPRKLTSLAKLVERYTGKVLDKNTFIRRSDWEEKLTDSQQACT